ncbi:MAG: D-TA family PLP-dependent enzyme [Fusobacteriaceae bacterium]|nr:D-TA family PLP-dependent enzyme [Fusobacteriaceae bacterium]
MIYYKEIIEENTRKAIAVAKSAENLWPHIKSHKMREMVLLQMTMGIKRFKCATIAEGEMLGMLKAPRVIVAYPLIGPNIKRFAKLVKTYPDTEFFAIGDDLKQLKLLGNCAVENGEFYQVLVDMNLGMNRTGVPCAQSAAFYEKASPIPGIQLRGFHCYDGHHGIPDLEERQSAVDAVHEKIRAVKEELAAKNLPCEILVMGGTPSFPCHARHEGVYLSPGTLFLSDYGYCSKFKDMPFVPGALVLTRVVSHPEKGYFTLDLGHKGIAADPPGSRGKIVGLDHVVEMGQSEEHWVFRMEEGHEGEVPAIGTELYVIPTHICPTTALYPAVLVAEHGEIVDTWSVDARNRKLEI